MKRYIFFIAALLSALFATAQTECCDEASGLVRDAVNVFGGETFELNGALSGNASYEYTASYSIDLLSGFNYSPQSGCHGEFSSDVYLLPTPLYGSESGSVDNNHGEGIAQSVPLSFTVTDQGAAVIDTPLDFPDGVNGVNPNLSVVYNSQGGCGIMGLGYSIGGMSKISRVPYGYFRHGDSHAVEFTDDDDLSLNGVKLLKSSSNDNYYYLELFDKSVIKKTSEGFTQLKPDGTVLEFNAKYMINGIDEPLEWHLSKSTDVYGNTIEYTYINDVEYGCFYPHKIEYGGQSDSAPIYRISFDYYNDDDRPDTQKKYFSKNLGGVRLSGFSKIAKVLWHIKCDYISGGEERVVCKYEFNYQQKGEFGDKELICLTKSGAGHTLGDGVLDDKDYGLNNLANISFEWENPHYQLDRDYIGAINSYQNYSQSFEQKCVLAGRFFDAAIDAGGQYDKSESDLAVLMWDEALKFHKLVILRNKHSLYGGNMYSFENKYDLLEEINDDFDDKRTIDNMFLCDYDGDGVNEILYVARYSQYCDVNLIYRDKNDKKFHEKKVLEQIPNSDFAKFNVGDFNGDGLTDLFCVNVGANNNPVIWMNGIDGIQPSQKVTNTGINMQNAEEICIGDFYGNRKDAVMYMSKNLNHASHSKAYIFDVKNQNGTFQIPAICEVNADFADYLYTTGSNNGGTKYRIKYGDFNNDLKLDVVAASSSEWRFYLSKGNGQFTDAVSVTDTNIIGGINAYDNLIVADFNGDGYSDFCSWHYEIKSFFEPPGQQNFQTEYQVLFRRDYLIRIDNYEGSDILRIVPRRMTDEFEEEMYVARTPAYLGGNYFNAYNVFMPAVGCFKGSSPNEVMFTHLSVSNDGTYIDICINNSGNLNLPQVKAISKIVDGLGQTTNIEYCQHTMQDKVQMEGREEQRSVTNAIIPFTGYLGVVKRTVQDVSADRSGKVTIYHFDSPLLHTQGRGFLGFKQAWSKSETHNNGMFLCNVTTYDIDANSNDMFPTSRKCYLMKDNVYKYYIHSEKYEYNYYPCDNSSSSMHGFLSSGFNIPFGVYYPFLKSKTVEEYERGSLYLTTKETYTDLDGFGSPKQVKKTFDGNGQSGYYSTTRTYSNVVNQRKLLIGLPLSETMSQNLVGNGKFVINRTQYTYSNGILTSCTTAVGDAKQMLEKYEHDKFGNITSISRNGSGQTRVEKFEYSPNGHLRKSTTDANGNVTKYEYYEHAGLVKKVTDPNGFITSYIYNCLGNISQINYPDGTVEAFRKRWTRVQGTEEHPDMPKFGDPVYYTWSKKTGAPETTTFYDKGHRKIRDVSVLLNGVKIYTDYTYFDKSNLVKTVSNPYICTEGPNGITKYTYDDISRLTTTSKPDRSSQSVLYNGLTIKTTDFDGVEKIVTKTPTGLVKSASHNGVKVSYDYYGDGNVWKSTVTDDDNTTIEYAYDVNGFKTQVKDPSLGIKKYDYNVFGELVSENNKKDNVSYSYDKLGRIVSRRGNDGHTEWTYDEQVIGLPDGATYKPKSGPTVKEVYLYDKYGRMISESQDINGQILSFNYTYDVYGRQKRIEYPSGFSIENIFDLNGFIRSINSNEGCVWKAVDVDAWGNVSKYELGDGVKIVSKYSPLNGLLLSRNASCGIQQTYRWSTEGNLVSRYDGIHTETFSYDELNRLQSIDINGQSTDISYSSNGNIMSKTDAGTMSYGSSNPYAVTSMKTGKTNLSKEQLVTYTYFDKVSEIKQGDDKLTVYYGPDRQRVIHEYQKQGNAKLTKRFFTNLYETVTGGGIIADNNGDEKRFHYLTSPSGLYAILVTSPKGKNEIHYVIKDHLGSLVATVCNSLVTRYSYDAWGRRRNPVTLSYDNVTSHFDRGFTMHEHYDDFGLINMNGRMYDPLVGRMLSPDIVIQDEHNPQAYNRYSYCLNNPLRFTDPSGYVTTIPPEFKDYYHPELIGDYESYKEKLIEQGAKNVSYNTESSEGKETTTLSWRINSSSYKMEIVDHQLNGYGEICKNSCVADAFAAQEARFEYGNKGLTPEEIMSWKENSCEYGLIASDIIPLFLKQSEVYSGIPTYTPMNDNNGISYYEERAYFEMGMNRGVFFKFDLPEPGIGHMVNASIAIRFSIDNQVKAHEIQIWDSGNDNGKPRGYRSLLFYDLNKLFGKYGVFNK